jgi:hypothetical protein
LVLFGVYETFLMILHEQWLPMPTSAVPQAAAMMESARLLESRHNKAPVFVSPAHTTAAIPPPTDKADSIRNSSKIPKATNAVSADARSEKSSSLPMSPSFSNHNNNNNNNKAANDSATPRQKPPPKKRRWDPGARAAQLAAPVLLQVPTPIFVASLPKSGTTSIWQYFQCGGHAASHQWIKVLEDDPAAKAVASNGTNTVPVAAATSSSMQSGACIRRNIARNRPPFAGCGQSPVLTDTGFANFAGPGLADCYYPSMDALDAIYESYPTATILLVVRQTASWLTSMQAHGEGSLLLRWKNCNLTRRAGLAPEDLTALYEWHSRHVRDFCAAHPSLTYIEAALEDASVGAYLQERIGIAASCWGKCTSTSKYCEPVVT